MGFYTPSPPPVPPPAPPRDMVVEREGIAWVRPISPAKTDKEYYDIYKKWSKPAPSKSNILARFWYWCTH